MNSISIAQETCIKKGDLIVDAYYGFPFFYKSVLKATYEKPNNNSSIHSTNHIGGKFEYMLNDKIGVGAEAAYAAAEISYLDSNTRFSAGITKIRVLAKINYHFAAHKKLDPYVTLGAGYMNFNYYQEKSSPNNLTTNSFVESIIPLAFRAGFGLHYFFTDFIGIHAEVGIGGPLVQGGLSVKF